MKKKIIYTAIIAAIIIVAAIVSYILVKDSDNVKSGMFEAVSKNSAVIINIKNVDEFLYKIENENDIYKNFTILSNLNSDNSLLHFIDSINKLSSTDLNTSTNNPVVCSFRMDGTKIEQICISAIPKEVKENKFHSSLMSSLKNIGTIKTRTYNDSEIIELTPAKSAKKLHICTKNNLLILSFSSILLEESLNMLKEGKGSVTSETGFNNVYATAGKNEIANIYINMSNFPKILNNYLNTASLPQIANLKFFSGWTELDLNIYTDRINLNGFIEQNDSLPDFVKIPYSQHQTEITSLEVLPNTTSYYTAFAFNNWKEYDRNLTEYLKQTGVNKSRTEQIEKIEKTTGINIKSQFYHLVENEICFAITSTKPEDLFTNSFTVFKVNSQSAAIQELRNISESLSKKLNKPLSSYTETLKIDQNTSIESFILPFDNLPELLFGPVFKNCKGNYVCCVKNYILFANTKDALFKFVYDALLNNTLSTSIEHNLFLEHFSKKSNIFSYFSFFKGCDILMNALDEKLKNELLNNREYVYKLGNLGYQINKSNEMLYNNIVLKYSDNIEIKSQTMWESRLDSTISIKPTIVTNHDDNSKEIIVQDKQNILYLLSNSGRIIWKLQLDEQITGKIYQIDFYKNKKLQYIFSTKSKIHIIDRLGNYIEKYPLKLRETATAPMSLFDYENDKNYRIIIPCKDRKVYLYNLDGSIIKGWDFQSSENEVTSEISHYRIKTEDFIVFNDEYKPYFVSRTGQPKINFNTKFKFSSKNRIWLDSSTKTPQFVTTDESGTIRIFHTNGKQDSVFIKKFSDGHHFAVKDVNCDGKNDYVFTDGNTLEVYDRSKKLILSYEFESGISFEPSFYSFPNNQVKIGIVCSEPGKIYLVNHDGSLFDEFPLHGLSQFSIGNLKDAENKFNLIVGGSDNLLYNYEIKY